MNSQKNGVLGGVMLCALLYGADAVAYLDPATGSMIIQGIIGAVAGAVVVLKLYWYQFKRWLARLTGKNEPVPTDSILATESDPSPPVKD